MLRRVPLLDRWLAARRGLVFVVLSNCAPEAMGSIRGWEMSFNVERDRPEAGKSASVSLMSGDGSVAWYQVVGIEFVLFAGIVVPLLCGALLAR